MALKLHSTRNILPYLFHSLRETGSAGWPDAVSGMPIQSDQDSETHVGLGNVAPMKEWNGPRELEDLREVSIIIKNKRFSSGLRVEGNELRRDKTQQVQRKIDNLSGRARQHWEKLLTSVIKLGKTQNAYDGQTYYSTTHSEAKSGTQSNRLTVTGVTVPSNPTPTEAEKAIFEGIETLISLVDDQGEPANEGPRSFVVMFPPGLLRGIAGALNVPLGDGGASNVLVNMSGFSFMLVPNTRLKLAGDGGAWSVEFVMFVNNGFALIRQFEPVRGGEFQVDAKAAGSEFEFDHDAHAYAVMSLRNAGYGRWQESVHITLTT